MLRIKILIINILQDSMFCMSVDFLVSSTDVMI